MPLSPRIMTPRPYTDIKTPDIVSIGANFSSKNVIKSAVKRYVSRFVRNTGKLLCIATSLSIGGISFPLVIIIHGVRPSIKNWNLARWSSSLIVRINSDSLLPMITIRRGSVLLNTPASSNPGRFKS